MGRILGIVGCGKIAYALANGICKGNSQFDSIYVADIDSVRTNLFKDEFGAVEQDLKDLIVLSDIIIIAVKPNQAKKVFEDTIGLWNESKLLISVMAGIKTAAIEKALGQVRVVRVMPNTPCLVNLGITAICRGKNVLDEDAFFAKNIFDTVGTSVMVDEKQMDAVTAVSGSGPAYIMLVIEAMIDGGLNVGLDLSTSRELVLQTMKGSVVLLEATTKHPAVLREEVCSPGGTTIAGVRQLEEYRVRAAFFQAIEKAFLRSVELGKN